MPNVVSNFQNKDIKDKFSLALFLIAATITLLIGIDHLIKDRIFLGLGTLSASALYSYVSYLCVKKRYKTEILLWLVVPFFSIFLALATLEKGIMILFWCYPTVLSYQFLFPKRQSYLAIFFFLACMLPVAWTILDAEMMSRFVLTLMCNSLFAFLFLKYIDNQREQLEKVAITDPLTGLLNRVILKEKLEHMIYQNQRFGSPMSLISLDIDFFKRINDQYGHDKGDEILIAISAYLKQRIRGVDLVFRMGGEEFLILLFDTSEQNAATVAEEIRQHFNHLNFEPNIEISASFGIAKLKENETQTEWLKRCDEKLYLAKEQGRNTVIV